MAGGGQVALGSDEIGGGFLPVFKEVLGPFDDEVDRELGEMLGDAGFYGRVFAEGFGQGLGDAFHVTQSAWHARFPIRSVGPVDVMCSLAFSLYCTRAGCERTGCLLVVGGLDERIACSAARGGPAGSHRPDALRSRRS